MRLNHNIIKLNQIIKQQIEKSLRLKLKEMQTSKHAWTMRYYPLGRQYNDLERLRVTLSFANLSKRGR